MWISLAFSIASATAWLWLLSARITGKTVADVVADGTAWIVLTQTQFGLAWEIRLLLAFLLAVCALLRKEAGEGSASASLMIATALLAGAYLGGIAFAGHGAEGLGFQRTTHIVSDVLHLNAAGLWLGGLVPLTLVLFYLRRFREDDAPVAAAAIAGRFSSIGIFAVGVLLVSGTINAGVLLDGMGNLIDAPYGRLLLLKIVLFAVMVGVAGINRQRLLPQLQQALKFERGSRPVDQLFRNSLIEIALGIAIVVIVGTLGVMPPANQIGVHVH
jgi:putative copper resistance protein D